MPEKDNSCGVCEEKMFASIFKANIRSLRNYLFYKFGNAEQANDMAQEAFIKLWENCKSVSAEKARSYLYTVANNSTLNQIAHQKVVMEFAKNAKTIHATSENPEFLMEKDQFEQKLNKAIANLNEGQRIAFLMNRIEGKKYHEIAEILEISVKAVEKRISGALISLRTDIKGFK